MTRPDNKFSPDYWGGADIFDESLFLEASFHQPDVHLDYRQLKKCHEQLKYGIGQLIVGNSTDVKYAANREFNPDINDGTMVIVDTEHLSRTTYSDPEYSRASRAAPEAPPKKNVPITQPFGDYWLRNQDYTLKPNDLGTESLSWDDELVSYVRYLNFGVLATQGNARFIQRFSFSTTMLKSNNTVVTNLQPRRHGALNDRAIPMPIAIGQTQIEPRLSFNHPAVDGMHVSLDAMRRIRSIDIIYPVSSSKMRQKQRTAGLLGSLTLPWFRAGQVPN